MRDLVIMREGQLIAPRHTTHRGYEPDLSIPVTELDEIREADSALLDESPSEGMVARSKELGNWQEEYDPTKPGYPGYGADDPRDCVGAAGTGRDNSLDREPPPLRTQGVVGLAGGAAHADGDGRHQIVW